MLYYFLKDESNGDDIIILRVIDGPIYDTKKKFNRYRFDMVYKNGVRIERSFRLIDHSLEYLNDYYDCEEPFWCECEWDKEMDGNIDIEEQIDYPYAYSKNFDSDEEAILWYKLSDIS